MRKELELYTLSRDKSDPLWFLDTITFIKATGAQTGGKYSLVEQLLPAGSGSPYHVHHGEDEAFYILEGETTFINGDRTFKLTTGSYIFLPRGVPHGFRVDATCRLLLLAFPAGFDEFILEMSEPAKESRIPYGRTFDPEELTSVAARYNIEILGPLPEI